MERFDGRKSDQIRKVEIERNFIEHAEGSCLIKMGNTWVIVTATVEERVPGWLKGAGQGWVTAEYSMIPRATIDRVPREAVRGKQKGRTKEIQRLIGRSLRAITDLFELGELMVTVDCDVIKADGGTRTASITGGYVALKDAFDYLVERGRIKNNPVLEPVAAISAGMIEGEYILDLSSEEDYDADVDLNVVMTESSKLVEIQGTAEKKNFSRKDLDNMIELAEKGIKKLVTIQKNCLGIS